MSKIRVTCLKCRNEVDLHPEEIKLRVVRPANDPQGVAEGSTFDFYCFRCDEVIVRPADERIYQLLRAGEVDVIEHPMRPRATHPENPPGGPPLTYDDLLDLHLYLRRPGWFDELLELVRGDRI